MHEAERAAVPARRVAVEQVVDDGASVASRLERRAAAIAAGGIVDEMEALQRHAVATAPSVDGDAAAVIRRAVAGDQGVREQDIARVGAQDGPAVALVGDAAGEDEAVDLEPALSVRQTSNDQPHAVGAVGLWRGVVASGTGSPVYWRIE